MATKKKSANTEGLSLGEFRAWLSGIEDMQGDDWAPNLEQWKRIKSKIADIVEDEAIVSTPTMAPARLPQHPGYAPVQPYIPPPSAQGVAPAPQQRPPVGMAIGQSGGLKTPDIDSSGGYESSLV